jgi:hypothetical protein
MSSHDKAGFEYYLQQIQQTATSITEIKNAPSIESGVEDADIAVQLQQRSSQQLQKDAVGVDYYISRSLQDEQAQAGDVVIDSLRLLLSIFRLVDKEERAKFLEVMRKCKLDVTRFNPAVRKLIESKLIVIYKPSADPVDATIELTSTGKEIAVMLTSMLGR